MKSIQLGAPMKKILIILCLLMLVGCKTPTIKDIDEVTLYSINDFHGDVLDSEESLSRIGNYLMAQKLINPNSLFLAAGDMFQGSAISNITRGNVVVDVMNEIGFDAMTIGNHEFDWGTDVIAGFHDGEGLDAEFPLICANIYDQETEQPVTWAEPYAITSRGDVKIGIIGLIGQYLTGSISPTIIQDYYFISEVSVVEQYVPYLRLVEGCDLVIVSAHANTESLNQTFADMSGDYQIDAVINAHTHYGYNEVIMGSDDLPMPVVQASSHGRKIGKIVLELDEENHLKSATTDLIDVSSDLGPESQKLNTIINEYDAEVKPITDVVLGEAGYEIERYDGTGWAASALQVETGMDLAIINEGGISSNAFPIASGEVVTVGHIWKIMPFDNLVKTVDMTVDDLIFSYYRTGCRLSENAFIYDNILTLNGIEMDGTDVISVATIDYLFDNPSYRYLEGENIVNTGIYFRDMLIDNLQSVCAGGAKWYGNAK